MAHRQLGSPARWAAASFAAVAATLGSVASSGAQMPDVVTIEVVPKHPEVGGSIIVSGTCQGTVVVVSLGTTGRPNILVTPYLEVDPDTHGYATDLDLPTDLPDGFTATATCGSDPDVVLDTASQTVTYAQAAATSTTAPPAAAAPAVSSDPSFTG
jgi:hypothetical protein